MLTKSQLAKKLGVSPAYITKLAKAGVLKFNADGKIDYADAKKALEENITPRSTVSDTDTLLKVKIKDTYFKALINEMKYQTLKKELIPVKDVKIFLFNLGRFLKDYLNAITLRLPPLLKGKSEREIEEIMKREVENLIEEIGVKVDKIFSDAS